MQSQDIAPPPPASPPEPSPVIRNPVQVFVDGKPIASNPQAVYKGLVHQREELGNQLERLQDNRREISQKLRDEQTLDDADKAGLQRRLTTIDSRIEATDKQIAAVDAQVASAAAVPGAVVEPPPYVRHGPPEEVFVLGGIFMFVAILPISIAYARRIWRRSAKVVAAFPGDIIERFTQIDQAVESIAVEVERIGEGQRFITRVLSEQGSRAALGEGVPRALEARPRSGD